MQRHQHQPPQARNAASTAPLPPPHPAQSGQLTARTSVPGLYSSTGFDMISILVRVASRPHPVVSIGPVDMSCSFAVSDARKPDQPIVYVSSTFEKLTGYSNSEIVGRNCRFLQSPDGLVNEGAFRRYTDNATVYELKKSLNEFRECQFTLINYRKGGEPFINLVTIVPITWENDNEIAFFVGFQVDLVEQPNAIIENMKEGTYVVNYRMSELPSRQMESKHPHWEYPELQGSDLAHEPPKHNLMADILKMINSTDPVEASLIFHKTIVDQCDFVHVLSLRGVFLYVSPDCARLLEYSESELLYHSLSEFCHPGDLVSVMRELKESSSNQNGGRVRVLFRIRRKHSGYMWLEAHGKCSQDGKSKGKKFVMLSGRERAIPRLSRMDLRRAGGTCLGDFWAKISMEGLFMYVAEETKGIGGYGASELLGKSLVDIVHDLECPALLQALQRASQGCVAAFCCHFKPPAGTFDSTSTLDTDSTYSRVQLTLFPGNSSNPARVRFFLLRMNDPLRTKHQLKGTCHTDPQYDITFFTATPESHTGAGDGDLDSGKNEDNDDVFEEMGSVRCTSWQYEVHRLRKAAGEYEMDAKSRRASSKPVGLPSPRLTATPQPPHPVHAS